MSTRTLLVGIDEAGYGPLLGPLVVSAAGFEVPAEAADLSLWSLLRGSVSRSAKPRDSRIAILDSKKLHVPKDGPGRIERSALAVVGAWRGLPPGLRGLLGLVAPQAAEPLAQYAWYRDADPPLPKAADGGGIRIASRLMHEDLEAKAIRVAGLWCEVLPEGHYNRMVKTTSNKAVVLLGLTLRLMQRVADAYPDREIQFFIDKQGAREHYGPMLLRGFEDRRLRVLDEQPEHSAYEMVDGRSTWRVSFRQSGESHHLPTALASIISKYLRELFMGCFNDYWQRMVPALKPTAGYYTDGSRFIQEVQPHLARLGIARETLVRRC